tara:strand:+ start:462 stop:641 length:180 start_codon:yes stop_codon:yes gene_type:complete
MISKLMKKVIACYAKTSGTTELIALCHMIQNVEQHLEQLKEYRQHLFEKDSVLHKDKLQ